MRNVFYFIILTVGVDVAETAGKYWNDRAPPFYCSQITFLQLTISCDEIFIYTEKFYRKLHTKEYPEQHLVIFGNFNSCSQIHDNMVQNIQRKKENERFHLQKQFAPK